MELKTDLSLNRYKRYSLTKKARDRRKKYDSTEKGKLNRKRSDIKRTYGITLEQYNELFIKQNHCCAICGTHQSELKVSLSLDHDHKTGVVRGLLCNKCNRAIGLLGDSVEALEKAMVYLRKVENGNA